MKSAEVITVPAEFRCEGRLGRFPDETERSYRAWLVDRTIPALRVLCAISLVLWAVVPPGNRLFVGGGEPEAVWWLTYTVVMPVILVCYLATYSKLRNRVVALAALMLLLVGGGCMWAFHEQYGSIGGMVVSAIWFTFITQFEGLPTRTTAVVSVVLSGGALAWVCVDLAQGQATAEEMWPYCVFLMAVFPIVIGMAIAGERLSRKSFVDERLLVESQRLIRRYVPAAVADRIESGAGVEVDVPQRRRVTILFSDVVGFTDLADQLDPESLTQIINEYLSAMAEIVDAHGGTLNEFAGDGFMAVFGAPATMTPEQQVHAALAAAHQIQAQLPGLNEGWYRLGIDHPLQTRIGINTGVLSVGTFGSAGRATYTAIGLQTNIAARIQAQCEPGGILLSHSSWQLVKDQDPCEPRGEVTVKGVHFPIKVYAPQLQDV